MPDDVAVEEGAAVAEAPGAEQPAEGGGAQVPAAQPQPDPRLLGAFAQREAGYQEARVEQAIVARTESERPKYEKAREQWKLQRERTALDGVKKTLYAERVNQQY